MNIAMILPSLASKGPILVAYDLVSLLMEQGHKCEVFYFNDIVEQGFPCKTQCIGLWSSFDFCEFDVIHAHGSLPSIFVSLRKPLFSKVRTCITLHNYMFEDFFYLYGKVKGSILGGISLLSVLRFDKIVALSQHAQSYYKKLLPFKHIDYVYNTRLCKDNEPLSACLLEKIEVFRAGRVLLGTNCVVIKRKGLHQIIEALVKLPDYCFCIVGDGDERCDLEALAVRLGVADQVLFMGHQDKAYRFLPLYDIFMIPSYSEGFPLALLEAMQFSKSIVCSDIPVFREIVSNDEVVMHRLDDVDDVVRALQLAVENRSVMEYAVQTKYKDYYSPDVFVERYLQIYSV